MKYESSVKINNFKSNQCGLWDFFRKGEFRSYDPIYKKMYYEPSFEVIDDGCPVMIYSGIKLPNRHSRKQIKIYEDDIIQIEYKPLISDKERTEYRFYKVCFYESSFGIVSPDESGPLKTGFYTLNYILRWLYRGSKKVLHCGNIWEGDYDWVIKKEEEFFSNNSQKRMFIR